MKELTADHFNSYKAERAKTCSIVAIGNEVTRVKTMFKWLAASKLASLPDFGPDFRKPSAKALRRAKREAGERFFQANQIRAMLDEAGVQMRAMILLGINAAFGPSDLAQLPMSTVADAASGSLMLDAKPKSID